MYRSKKEVDKHVENLISKLSVKEFKTRAHSVARLYFEVGDYASCQRYVEQYLTQKDNNAAAHQLLGQALQKLGHKEKALEQYKMSLDIDPTQTSIILEICELLADDEVAIDPGRAKYWCEKAEATFPRHPVTFRLRERLVTLSNPDPAALVKLLTAELAIRPKDVTLHSRLLKHYLETNQLKEAFDHSCNVEFRDQPFLNNFTWYEILTDLFKHIGLKNNEWLYQLLLLTVKERICFLSLTEIPTGTSKSLTESTELLHAYDQAIETVAKTGAPSSFGEFHAALLQHHRGQFAFHAATLLLKKAKKDQLSWRDATRTAAPLMLIAWQTVPLDLKVNWLSHAPDRQNVAVRRWYIDGNYRCSQAGNYLLTNIQDKSQSLLDRISQTCSGSHWKDKIYEKLFTSRDHLAKIKTSHLVSNAYGTPVLRLPRRIEVEAYDVDAQKEYPNSLHHFVWTLLNYKNYSHFKCTLFDMLTPTATNFGPETLNKLDVYAFLYFTTLTSRQQKKSEGSYFVSDKPIVLPANITDLLPSLPQMKWWDCAYKFSQNELGSELTDIRTTLSRGIEVVRCIDNHGLDPELLCITGSIFSERAKLTTSVDEKNKLEIRAGLYYSSALPLLEKLKSKIVIKIPEKRLFDYMHKELSNKELNSYIEESKLYVAVNHLNDCEYDKVIDLLSTLKSPQAYYYLSQTYKKIALEESNVSRDSSVETKNKIVTLMLKAKNYAYKALDKVKDTELNKNHPLYSEIQQQVEDVETQINKMDPDFSGIDIDGKYSSDENISSTGSEHLPLRSNHQSMRASSFQISTPKQSNSNTTNYRTAIDSNMLESTRVDPLFLEKIENQIKTVQKKFADDFMEQTKTWFEENRRMGNQIMTTIQNDIQNTTDQFKLLKISVDQVKSQIDECRNECKDVGDLKKQFAELKKEVNKLKKNSEQGESDLYHLEEDYRTNEASSNFASQLPFQTPPVMPPFNSRLLPPFPVPPNPYHLYSQSLYNLYSQYNQFAQPPQVPGAPPLFDPTKLNYSGMYPTPDQMYLDIAHLVPPNLQAASSVPPAPTMPVVPSTSSGPIVSVPSAVSVSISKSSSTSKSPSAVESKEMTKALPVNVVITSSDPLPTGVATPSPVLSVIIPPKHIKGTPHNYQIAMPSTSETNVLSPPVFSFPGGNKPAPVSSGSSVINWSKSNIFQTSQSGSANNSAFSDTFGKSVVDGSFTGASPNTSLNKSRTLSERSNTSIENYDPCPDFKPIIPLPAEVKVTTGEEDEATIFSARAKLFRFVDKEWKERGIGEMKLLKHKITGKVRVLMRREQIHKICANHIITQDMEIKPMKNELKAYFWVANDFADETVVLEKFCVRFKTADIARNFYETFEKARLEACNATTPKKDDKVVNNNRQKPDWSIETATVQLKNTNVPTVSPQNKTQFGGFTFSSTPTLKKVEDAKTDAPPEPITTKVNVFSTLNFKTTTSSPFSNLFTSSPMTNTSSPLTTNTSVEQKQDTPKKLNTSDVVEDYEPNVEFKPVIPLPALVDQKTGEENEIVLFEHRAKLLRFDAASKEWKERGLGNIKLLVHKENVQKVRLLMRREQIMKVCCNHAVTKEMTFQKMPNMDQAVTWCAKDFSEGELTAETFCLRFKTVQICDLFMDALKEAQSKMTDKSKAAKEEQNAAKQIGHVQIGFGEKFKPKAGSWHCDTCYTNNLDSFAKCACCEQPRPKTEGNEKNSETPGVTSQTGWGDKFKPKSGSWECKECLIRNESIIDYCSACNNPKDLNMPKKENIFAVPDGTPKFNFGIPSQTEHTRTPTITSNVASTTVTSGWGDKFKPKSGSWECKECLIRNESNIDYCSACNNPKDPNMPKKENILAVPAGTPKFNFGIPSQTEHNRTPTITSNVASTAFTSGWGDKFKPKEGSWECKQCFVRNEDNDKCSACTSPRDPNAINSQGKSLFVNVSSGPKFTFGNPKTTDADNKPKVETSIFDGTGAHKFNFGIPSNAQENASSVLTFGDLTPNVFGAPKASLENDSALNLSKQNIEAKNKEATPVKSALLPTPQTGRTPFGVKEAHNTFDFVFKPKTSPKGKSPAKSPKAEGEESDGNEYVSDDEGHHIHFNPVIPLPDKIDVVTGEEDEIELYGHRAKLFRFTSGEWKERGIGIVKILKHKNTGKLRVVMRREQVLKICLNHALTPEITYTSKDDKTWLFAANDYSEGELSLQQFCLRFKSKEIATEFKDAIENARTGKPTVMKASEASHKDDDSDDVVFVSEIQATVEEKQKAKELMLPENFFNYKNKEPCKGCRGCNDGEETKSDTTSPSPSVLSVTTTSTNSFATPLKSTVSSFQSPMTSFYGTPANFDKTSDTSIFRTPLGSLGSNDNSSPATSINTVFEKNATTKENSFSEKNIFGEVKATNIFGNPSSQNSSISSFFSAATNAGGDSTNKSSILAAPKLSTLNKSAGENGNPDVKSVFGFSSQPKTIASEAQSIFGNTNAGISSNQSVFGFSSENKANGDKPDVKSIFGGNTQKPINLFSGGPQGSLFGPGALGNDQDKPSTEGFVTFGANAQQGFGGGKSLFVSKQGTWTFGADTEQKKPDVKDNVTSSDEKQEGTNVEKEVPKDTPFKVDNDLSFAALSSNVSSSFSSQKKPDFKWEGAGQQLFTSAQKAGKDGDKSKNDSSAADESGAGADEEYDPHYEPIVPLPDKIVVTTGEEDEEKLFGERCKLYRYDDKSREWKERGVGEMKILHHPERKTYRLLLRREQVHKAVLNMLIFMDLELLPMKNSDRAWTWAGRNFAENSTGEQETLAVRFKSVELAAEFKDKMVECTRKLQVAAAQTVKEEKECGVAITEAVAPLRLPKHLESSARVDTEFSVKVQEQTQTNPILQCPGVSVQTDAPNGQIDKTTEVLKQVHFQDYQEHHHDDDDGEDEDYDNYDHNDDYDAYYNEDEEESAAYFECIGEATISQGNVHSSCDNAHIQVLFDQEVYSPKILVTDHDTGEILADMLIHTDTEFLMDGNSCFWSGIDYTSNDPVDKTVTVCFQDNDTALQFYDSCETSKSATYSSTDPES